MSDSTDLVPAKNATGSLVIRTMDDVARLGNMLAKSGYFTDARDAAQAGVKVLAGLEMGIGAFSAMAGIYIIEGRPSIGAGLMAAAVKRSGKYNYRVTSHTAEECVIDFLEDGELVGTSSFTIQDAKLAQLSFTTRSGAPAQWTKNPRNMLFARALSNGVRWYCPDVFQTSTYTPEELGAEVDDDGNVITVEARAREAAPAPTPAPEPEPEAEAEPTPEPEVDVDDAEFPPEPPENLFGDDSDTPDSADPPVTSPQLRKLAIDMGKVGLTDRDAARSFIAWAVNRPIASSKELTKREAMRLLDWDKDLWESRLDEYRSAATE